MAVNKIVYGERVLIDLTSDTVTAETLKTGMTAHAADGTVVTGTFIGEDSNPQSVTVTPSAEEQVIVPDTEEGYNCIDKVTVGAIPYTETENEFGGTTIEIG